MVGINVSTIVGSVGVRLDLDSDLAHCAATAETGSPRTSPVSTDFQFSELSSIAAQLPAFVKMSLLPQNWSTLPTCFEMNYFKPVGAAFLGLHATAVGSAYSGTQVESVCPVLPLGSWPLPTTCPLEISNSIDNETASAQDTQWYRSDTCHEVGQDEICAFTQPSFNAGRGIALVTTAQILQKMVSLPIFTNPGLEEPSPEYSVSLAYRDEHIPGKGIGLVATRPLRNSEAFLSRKPIVMVDDTAFKRLGRARLNDLLTQAIGDLPEAHQAEYLNLTTHGEVKTHDEKVYEIFMKNDFITPVEGIVDFHSVFPQGKYSRRHVERIDSSRLKGFLDVNLHGRVVSRLNHACRPNSKYTFDSSTLSQSVFAARKIETGEELTVTYFDSIQARTRRQLLSKHGWGFECTCSHCSASGETIKESDERVDQILMLQKDLDDYSSASAANPEKAELLVNLFKAEGLVTRMVEAYYRTAVEYNGIGSAEEAAMFAKLCIEEGEVLESSIRPFINNMRELVRDPSAHWTWRFRLSHK